jgi:hypothetical protein
LSQFESVPFEQRFSDFEIVLSMGEAADGSLSASLQYNADLFLPSTMQRLSEHFLNILRHVAKRFASPSFSPWFVVERI